MAKCDVREDLHKRLEFNPKGCWSVSKFVVQFVFQVWRKKAVRGSNQHLAKGYVAPAPGKEAPAAAADAGKGDAAAGALALAERTAALQQSRLALGPLQTLLVVQG